MVMIQIEKYDIIVFLKWLEKHNSYRKYSARKDKKVWKTN